MAHKISGSIAVVNGDVGLSVQGNRRASIELDWVPVTGDTIEFEGLAHPEGTWDSIEGQLMSDMNGTGVTSATDVGVWIFDVWGISRIRASASALSTTPVSVKMYAE